MTDNSEQTGWTPEYVELVNASCHQFRKRMQEAVFNDPTAPKIQPIIADISKAVLPETQEYEDDEFTLKLGDSLLHLMTPGQLATQDALRVKHAAHKAELDKIMAELGRTPRVKSDQHDAEIIAKQKSGSGL